MIDERINQTLSELESNLKNIEAARRQVEKTVNSYDGLQTATAEYVTELGNVTAKTKELVDTIGEDFFQRIKTLEEDRETIINAATTATQNLSNATEEFKNSLSEVKTRLKFSLIVNIISLVAIVAIIVLLMVK